MASNSAKFSTMLVTWFFLISFLIAGSYSATFKVVNKCSYTVWPAIGGSPPISTSGFTLHSGESNTIPLPPTWTGQLWGRTLCSHDTGKFFCVTGDCGSSTVECAGGKATPPVTVTGFSLSSSGGMDFYYVSLEGGFNLPVEVKPCGGTGKCKSTGSMVNLNDACPTLLKVTRGGEAVACKNACELTSQFCCNGPCNFSCANSDYLITFCPTSSSTRVGKYRAPAAILGGHDDKEGSGNSNNLMDLMKKKNSLIEVAVLVVSVLGLIACTITVKTRYCTIRASVGTRAQASPQPTISL